MSLLTDFWKEKYITDLKINLRTSLIQLYTSAILLGIWVTFSVINIYVKEFTPYWMGVFSLLLINFSIKIDTYNKAKDKMEKYK